MTSAPAVPDLASRRRWSILAVIAIAQLMVVLDNTIVNISLPSAQTDLGFADADRQWVVTAYALALGSLLLLGGRMSDLFGRKRASMVCAIAGSVATSTTVPATLLPRVGPKPLIFVGMLHGAGALFRLAQIDGTTT